MLFSEGMPKVQHPLASWNECSSRARSADVPAMACHYTRSRWLITPLTNSEGAHDSEMWTRAYSHEKSNVESRFDAADLFHGNHE